jgi:hypothetical protein
MSLEYEPSHIIECIQRPKKQDPIIIIILKKTKPKRV